MRGNYSSHLILLILEEELCDCCLHPEHRQMHNEGKGVLSVHAIWST